MEQVKSYPLEGGATVRFDVREDGKDKVLVATIRAGLPNGDGKYSESGAEVMRVREDGVAVKRPQFERVAAAYDQFVADQSPRPRRRAAPMEPNEAPQALVQPGRGDQQGAQ